MKLAIVHDFLNQYGGAEKCVEAFHELYPDAPVFTSIYLPHRMPDSFRSMDIRTSFMQRLPGLERHFKKYLMLYPKAIGSFDLSSYDVILSSSSAFAKGAKKKKGAAHICYCYTPMRFAWNFETYMAKEKVNPLVHRLLPLYLDRLKKWDLATNGGVDRFIAISRYIQTRITRCYNRDSDVIYPPVDVKKFAIAEKTENYFLVVSRLNAYKRIDLAIAACNRLELPLRIVGDGPHRKFLQEMAGPTIEFTGRLSEKELRATLEQCRAFIFPGEEDFGIAPVEAMAAGRPVIAYAAGGAMETVIPGQTGVFFEQQTPEALIECIREFEKTEHRFSPARIKESSEQYDIGVFKDKIRNYIAAHNDS